MNSDGYSAPPSNSNIYQRSPSLDTPSLTSYAPAPNISSNIHGHSGPQFPAQIQRTLPPDQPLSGPSPGRSDVRGLINSNNGITDHRHGVYSANDKSPGMSDLVHKNMSDNNNNGGLVGSQQKQPKISDVVGQRDRSTNGGETDESGESVDPRDYVGISLVGRKFKQVNPEAYYVEKDDQ